MVTFYGFGWFPGRQQRFSVAVVRIGRMGEQEGVGLKDRGGGRGSLKVLEVFVTQDVDIGFVGKTGIEAVFQAGGQRFL